MYQVEVLFCQDKLTDRSYVLVELLRSKFFRSLIYIASLSSVQIIEYTQKNFIELYDARHIKSCKKYKQTKYWVR